MLKRDHHLIAEEDIELTVKGGKRVKLSTVSQTGYGVNPIHYLIDDNGRVQLVTNAILSWALDSIG